jgi:hypothetical protein
LNTHSILIPPSTNPITSPERISPLRSGWISPDSLPPRPTRITLSVQSLKRCWMRFAADPFNGRPPRRPVLSRSVQ